MPAAAARSCISGNQHPERAALPDGLGHREVVSSAAEQKTDPPPVAGEGSECAASSATRGSDHSRPALRGLGDRRQSSPGVERRPYCAAHPDRHRRSAGPTTRDSKH